VKIRKKLIKDETENKIFTSKVRLASNKTEDSVKSEDDDESSQKETPLVTKDERISMAATIIILLVVERLWKQ